MSKKIIYFLIIIIALIFLFSYLNKNEEQVAINSFEECAQAGYPILESYPEQCMTPDGRSFTRELTEEEKNNMEIEIALTEEELNHINSKKDLIVLESPKPLQVVNTPLSLSGQARGYWFFEASFPIKIVDANNNVLGEHYATAITEWMTEDFVPFQAVLNFSTPTTDTGFLILSRDNPSDLPENDDELRIPVKFSEM